MKPKSPWNGAHVRLKRIYEERIGDSMTQKEFGRSSGIGSQSMVAQYLNGIRPLNYDTAALFAAALRCTIQDICPEMADSLREKILPVLGKALRRAAMVLLAIGLYQFAPSDARASSAFNIISAASAFSRQVDEFNTHCAAWLRKLWRWLCVYAPTAVEYT